MKEVLPIFMKRLIMGLGVITLAVGSMLVASGQTELIGALIIGFMTGLVFLGNMSLRLWRAAHATANHAKRQMLWGLVLRMMVLLLILLTAVNISAQVFGVTVLGFLICYGLSIFLLIHMNHGKE